jgi:hypothetical protein
LQRRQTRFAEPGEAPVAHLRLAPLGIEQNARSTPVELTAAPIALLASLSARDVKRVLLATREPVQVANVALLDRTVLAVEMTFELGERTLEVVAPGLAHAEKVPEVRQEPAIVRGNDHASWPATQPPAKPGHGIFVEMLARFVE